MKCFSLLVSICLAAATVWLAGCGASSKTKDYPVTAPRFLIEASGDNSGVNIQLPVSGVVIRCSPKAMITEYDVVGAEVVQTDLGPCVMFKLTSDAARDLYRLSATNLGSRLITTINGIPLGARMMDRPIGDGVIISYLEIDPEELTELVENINKTCVDLQKEIAKR